MKKIICLYGPPGAGKTTQAKLLVEKYGFSFFGMGERLRAEVESGSELGLTMKPYLEAGTLIPDECMKEIIKDAQKLSSETGLIFDGFPRILSQAHMLDEVLKSLNLSLNAFIFLDLGQEEAIERITKRAALGEVERSDDTDKTAIANRFSIFKKESIVLSEFYRQRDLLLKIDGSESIDEIHNKIVELLNL